MQMVGTLSVVTLLLLAMASQSSTLKDCSGGCTVDDDDASALLQARASVEIQDTLEIKDALKPEARNKMLLQDDRQHKLAATQKMEQAMQSEVEKMVNKGRGSRIPTTVLDSMVAEMEAMRTNLVGEHKNFQQQIYDASAAVETCNTDKDDTEGDSVAEAKGIMEKRNASHDTCRKAEVSAYNNKNISCELLATKSDETCKAAPTCNCGSERQCDADSVLACQEKHRQWLASSNDALKAQKADCDTKTTTWSSKADACDTHQSNYELAFCSYAQHVDTMCSTLATCHTRAVAAYESIVKLVRVEGEEIKALMASAKKIVCFLSVIRNSSSDNITMKDYNVCKNLNVHSDTTYLNSTVEDMTITYVAAADQVPCQNVISWPGDGQWADNAYAQYNQDWLRETAVCGHKTTTTTTGKAIVFEANAATWWGGSSVWTSTVGGYASTRMSGVTKQKRNGYQSVRIDSDGSYIDFENFKWGADVYAESSLEVFVYANDLSANNLNWFVGAMPVTHCMRYLLLKDNRVGGAAPSCMGYNQGGYGMGAVPVKKWVQIVGVYEKNRKEHVVVDGQKSPTREARGGSDTGKYLRLGTPLPNHHTDANIAMVRVYSKALSLEEIAASRKAFFEAKQQ